MRTKKVALLQRMEAGETVSKLADEVSVSSQRLYEWRDHLRVHGNLMSRRRGRPAGSTTAVEGATRRQQFWHEKALTKARHRIRELEQKVGQQQLDLDFFREAFGTSRKISVGAALLGSWRNGIFKVIEKMTNGLCTRWQIQTCETGNFSGVRRRVEGAV
ncbi:transposase [Mesorhizobium atlanticum]|uniref:Helix-turn-helix domain-containing protein n=1 Tax=Mesorhizobium atlanticum TaxID=2233532 RepID=A0A330GJY9_9HYPH|nr:transposase [Mesorhizobium atlanticum]RAZ71145.1 hypothetical protein DPM35_31635 [Mesorhizobium atlanticum]